MFKVLNNQVACVPLGSLAVETTGKDKGFMTAKQKSTLASTEVVFPPVYDPAKPGTALKAGDKVYFRADEIGQWLRHVYTVRMKSPITKEECDVSFVLVPLDQIKLVESNLVGPY